MERTVSASVLRGGRNGVGSSTDEELLASISSGEQAALAELYDRYGGFAFRLALRVLHNRQLAEDAVQEAFLGVWRSAAFFRAERGTARNWLLTLVHRRAVDLVRHESHRRTESIEDWWHRAAKLAAVHAGRPRRAAPGLAGLLRSRT